MSNEYPVCLDCGFYGDDPNHDDDCDSRNFLPESEADEVFAWVNGRHAFMVATGQREHTASTRGVTV